MQTGRLAPDAIAEPWTALERVIFRFFFVYLALFSVTTVAQLVARRLLPLHPPIIPRVWALWDPLLAWVGRNLLSLPYEIRYVPSGGSDILYYWVHAFTLLLIAGAAAAAWSLLDRYRKDYRRLYHLMRTALRYFLAFVMIEYGLTKIFRLQFGPAALPDLVRPLGEFTLESLIWTAIGSSATYTIFGGVIELVPALMLLFRRTATLGALMLLGVLGNVLMLNIGFGIPVKLFTMHLLLMAGVIIAGDWRRLAAFLLFDRDVPPRVPAPPPLSSLPGGPWTRWALKALVITFALAPVIWQDWQSYRSWGPGRPASVLEGIYDVVDLERDGELVAMQMGDSTVLHRLVTGRFGGVYLYFADGSRRFRQLEVDTLARRIIMRGSALPEPDTFNYAPTDSGLVLRGTLGGTSTVIVLRRMDPSEFALLNNRFRWIETQ